MCYFLVASDRNFSRAWRIPSAASPASAPDGAGSPSPSRVGRYDVVREFLHFAEEIPRCVSPVAEASPPAAAFLIAHGGFGPLALPPVPAG